MSRTRADFSEIHKQNVEFINQQIRTCLLARKLLGKDQSKYRWQILNCDEHNRPEMLPLKAATNNEYWSYRFQNYDKGILGKIFDIRYFISQARILHLKGK